MKPRFDQRRPNGRGVRPLRAYRPSAHELASESSLTRGEASLYFVLVGAALMALVQHVRVAHEFVQRLPEFAEVVANLVRNLV